MMFMELAKSAAEMVEKIGDYFQVMVPVYAFFFTAEKEGFRGTKQFLFGFLITMLIVFAMKHTIDAKRPNYQPGARMDSFPSRHTAAAFSGASFIHTRYGLQQALIPYALAAFTGYSRIIANKHYFRDIAAGALISFCCALLMSCCQSRLNAVNRAPPLRKKF
jgi:membrane-associated phospholipid phosphatase